MTDGNRGRAYVDVAALLEHRAWLQRLASHLVAPAGVAEDALQDTWLLALRHRPRDSGRARPWLARVLANAFRRRLRGDRRRLQREQAFAGWRGAVEAPAAAGLEQLQLQRRLIALVDALEEPFRSTVVMRYFEDRSAAEMARAMGVPEGTIRWRTHEALSRLRRALDDDSGGERRAWMAPLGTLAASGGGTGAGRSLVWLAAASLVVVLAGSAAVLRSPVGPANRPAERPPVSSRQVDVPPGRPMLAAAALALAARPLPPVEALAQARAVWASACPQTPIDGICATPTAAEGHVCPQAAQAGPRLAALPRAQAGAERAIGLWQRVSSDKALPYELRIQADLALAEAKLEAVLAIEPLRHLVLTQQSKAQFEDSHRRFQEFMQQLGTQTKEATWAFERLSGASDELPDVHMARARLGQTFAEAGRVKLAMQIPEGLPTMNRWGKDEQAAFCRSIAQNTGRLFEKARRQFRYCADAALKVNPAAAALCERELARLPPEPPPS